MINLSDEYKKSLCDVEKIIESFDPKLQEKIPQQFKNFVKTCKMPGYDSKYNPDLPPQYQQLSKTTASILAVIYYNYFCTTEEEKNLFVSSFK